jgi:hypothetical protein
MDVKLEHVSIIDKKNQLLCSSHKGDIQFFFGIVTFAPPCISATIIIVYFLMLYLFTNFIYRGSTLSTPLAFDIDSGI